MLSLDLIHSVRAVKLAKSCLFWRIECFLVGFVYSENSRKMKKRMMRAELLYCHQTVYVDVFLRFNPECSVWEMLGVFEGVTEDEGWRDVPQWTIEERRRVRTGERERDRQAEGGVERGYGSLFEELSWFAVRAYVSCLLFHLTVYPHLLICPIFCL